MIIRKNVLFENNWETLSAMTKSEILRDNLHSNRVIHRENWFREVHNILDAA